MLNLPQHIQLETSFLNDLEGKIERPPRDLIAFPSSFTSPSLYSKQNIINPKKDRPLSAQAVVVCIPLYSTNTHTWVPSSDDSVQWWAVCESPSVSQVRQFTQSPVTPLICLVQRKLFFFSPDSPHSFRGMRENLSALLWHSACCLCAVRPAAFPDLHCIVSVVLLVPRQNL